MSTQAWQAASPRRRVKTWSSTHLPLSVRRRPGPRAEAVLPACLSDRIDEGAAGGVRGFVVQSPLMIVGRPARCCSTSVTRSAAERTQAPRDLVDRGSATLRGEKGSPSSRASGRRSGLGDAARGRRTPPARCSACREDRASPASRRPSSEPVVGRQQRSKVPGLPCAWCSGDQTPHRRRRGLPQPVSLLRLAGAVLVEAHDEWQLSDRRYPSEGSMALLEPQPETQEEVAQRALIAS